MNEKYNSIGETLAYLIKLNKYATQILLKLNQATISTDDTVTIQLQNSDGNTFDYKIPSFSNLDRRINDIDSQIRKLYLVRDKDNNKDIFGNELVHEPNLVKNITVPTEFYTKPNYFFENLLNPLLYIKIPISDSVTNDAKNIVCRRLLLITDTDTKKEYFETNFNKRNNLDYDSVIRLLKIADIKYNIDEEILNLPPIILQYSGSFGVTTIGKENISNPTYKSVREYTLNTLNYTENLEDGTVVTKTLRGGNLGETLITTNGETHYKVISVDQNLNTVQLGLIYGYDVIEQGDDVLRISSKLSGNKYFDITVGSNERQIIFIKSINSYDHITTQKWGDGIGFLSSDLFIDTDNGTISLEDYYSTLVNDYSKIFNGIKDEQILPITTILKPNAPILNKDNFFINLINGQTITNDDSKRRSILIKRRDLLEQANITYNENYNTYDKMLETHTELTDEERASIVSTMNSIMEDKIKNMELILGIKKDFQIEIDNINKGVTIKHKFAIDGAWDIPAPKISSDNTEQYPTHFKIKATYLNASGETNVIPLKPFTTLTGNTTTLQIPVFNLYETHKRKNYIDSNGNIIKESFDLSDPNNRTINQLPQGIPIDVFSGEKVQIEVQSCIQSLNNEVCSDWSSPIIVEVPNDIKPQLQFNESIDTKLKYYYEIDRRNDDIDVIMKQLKYLTDKIDIISSLNHASEGSTVTYTLTDTDISNGYITLANILKTDWAGPDAFSVYVNGGLRGVRAIDYEVLADGRLVWQHYEWEDKLVGGDKITFNNVIYIF